MRTYDLLYFARRRHQWSSENRKMPALIAPPDKQTIRHVVNRAASWRRNQYRDGDRTRYFTEGALANQACGDVGVLFDLGDGWWLVGRVLDIIAAVELEVACRPRQTIRLREIVEPVVEKAPPLPLVPERPKLAPVST